MFLPLLDRGISGTIEGSGDMVAGSASMSGAAVLAGLTLGYVTREEKYITPVPLWRIDGIGTMRSGRATMSGNGSVDWTNYNEVVLLLMAA